MGGQSQTPDSLDDDDENDNDEDDDDELSEDDNFRQWLFGVTLLHSKSFSHLLDIATQEKEER